MNAWYHNSLVLQRTYQIIEPKPSISMADVFLLLPECNMRPLNLAQTVLPSQAAAAIEEDGGGVWCCYPAFLSASEYLPSLLSLVCHLNKVSLRAGRGNYPLASAALESSCKVMRRCWWALSANCLNMVRSHLPRVTLRSALPLCSDSLIIFNRLGEASFASVWSVLLWLDILSLR